MAKEEQHLTMARLSAYIDGQLSPEEQMQTETHLQNCVVCQQQLAELRQTVALLHSLPQPSLPRSFVLPAASDFALASPQVAHSAPISAPITPLPRRNGWPTYVTGAVRTVSTLAALVGIVFLLSGLFGTILPVGSSTTPARTSVTPTVGNGSGQSLPHSVLGTPEQATPSSNGQTVTTPTPHGNTHAQQTPWQAFLTFFSLGMIGTRAIIGAILLVLGIVGFIVVRRL